MATTEQSGSFIEFSRGQLLAASLVCAVLVGVAIGPGPRYALYLPAVNALLNGTATVLLVVGYVLIKQRRERAHTVAMLAAFAVSIVFLACYLVYHWQLHSTTGEAGKKFLGQGIIRPIYFTILISHIILAAMVPILAGLTIYYGFTNRRRSHRRIAVWAFPIWLYVSITGVVIYFMLYHLYASPPAGLTIQ